MCNQKAVLQEPPLPSDHRVISQDTLRTGLLIADILDQIIFWAHLWETVFIVEEGSNHLVSGARLLY